MGFILDNVIVELLCCCLLLLILMYCYVTKNYNYWEKRGVPCVKAKFPFGSSKDMVFEKYCSAKAHDKFYKQFTKHRFYGMIDFVKPLLVITDPDLIKMVTVKDFQHFTDRPQAVADPKESTFLGLFGLRGKAWKDTRAKITPIFTTSKIKAMFEFVDNNCNMLVQRLETENGKEINATNIFARFIIDISTCYIYGLESNSLNDQNDIFFKTLGGVAKTTKFRFVKRLIVIYSALVKTVTFKLISQEVKDLIINTVRNVVEYKLKTNTERNDMVGYMVKMANIEISTTEENTNPTMKSEPLQDSTIEQISAHTFSLLIGGYESSTSNMTFCLYELSRHQDIQEKLYQEIRQAMEKNAGRFSYDTLKNISFLDQVFKETLRSYGTTQGITRICTLPYQVPGTNLVLEKGHRILVPVYSLHHDPRYYPDPYEFQPERFTSEVSKERHRSLFMPFGDGPRKCIGERIGHVLTKIGIATVILNFRVEISSSQGPIEIHPYAVALQPAKPVWLKFIKR
uniref:Cytochrome P450 n=2 Tax=Graphocephala atropunctata TaxID=36148 RepID=A0A1B6M4B3_9HEMI